MVGVPGLSLKVVGTKLVLCDIVGKIEVEVSSKVGVLGLLGIVVGTKVMLKCVDM